MKSQSASNTHTAHDTALRYYSYDSCFVYKCNQYDATRRKGILGFPAQVRTLQLSMHRDRCHRSSPALTLRADEEVVVPSNLITRSRISSAAPYATVASLSHTSYPATDLCEKSMMCMYKTSRIVSISYALGKTLHFIMHH